MRQIIIIAFSILLITGPATADEVLDQIDFAKKLYKDKKYNKAVKELGFIINEIQAKLSKQFGKNFPPAQKGWKKGKVNSQNMGAMGGGQMTSVNYNEISGRGRVKATIMVDSPMIRGVSMMLNNPALMGMGGRGDQEIKRIRINGEYGLLKWNPVRKKGDLSVILGGGRLMLNLDGRKLKDVKILREMMKKWDYDAAKKTAGL